jgi:hypothetical protein
MLIRVQKVKVKMSLKQAVKFHKVVGRRGSHIFYTFGPQLAVRLSALLAGRDSAVSIATGYGARRPISQSLSPDRVKNFLFSKSSRPALVSTQPPIQWVPGALSQGVKLPGREAINSAPTSAEIKMWIYTSASLYAFMA